jgi:hypothetical protein
MNKNFQYRYWDSATSKTQNKYRKKIGGYNVEFWSEEVLVGGLVWIFEYQDVRDGKIFTHYAEPHTFPIAHKLLKIKQYKHIGDGKLKYHSWVKTV